MTEFERILQVVRNYVEGFHGAEPEEATSEHRVHSE